MSTQISERIESLMADGRERTLGDILRALGGSGQSRPMSIRSEVMRLRREGVLARSELHSQGIFRRAAQ